VSRKLKEEAGLHSTQEVQECGRKREKGGSQPSLQKKKTKQNKQATLQTMSIRVQILLEKEETRLEVPPVNALGSCGSLVQQLELAKKEINSFLTSKLEGKQKVEEDGEPNAHAFLFLSFLFFFSDFFFSDDEEMEEEEEEEIDNATKKSKK
jgi:hypothetical protein